jgi:hypothetical protein
MNYAENAIEPDKPGILRDRRRSMKPPNSSHTVNAGVILHRRAGAKMHHA